jgi:enoyl-CoA hydratase
MTERTAYEQVGDVAVIAMDDGKANAFGPHMIAEVDAQLDRAAQAAKAVVLTGRPGMLSGGFDLKVIQSGDAAAARNMLTSGGRLMMRLYSLPQPLVVAATGHAIALGAFCVMTGDYRLVAEGDYRIGLNEVAIGATLPPFAWLLAKERLSKRHLSDAVLAAKMYEPASARDAGFVDEVVTADTLRDRAIEHAAQLAEFDFDAYQGIKQGLRGEGVNAVLAGLSEGS